MPAKFDPSKLPPAPDLSFEIALWGSGIYRVAGVDEAGRGALAGPVAAAVVILPAEPSIQHHLQGVDDSKRLTPILRAHWAVRLREIALAWEVGTASNDEIDAIGIVPAVHLAVERAIDRLRLQPEHLLIDYLNLQEVSIPQTSLVKGDQRSLSIAAASILAKTARDMMMCHLDVKYPGYGFAHHKGYSTQAHRNALALLGPSPAHRISFNLS